MVRATDDTTRPRGRRCRDRGRRHRPPPAECRKAESACVQLPGSDSVSLQGENLDRRPGGLATSVATLPLNPKEYEFLRRLCRRCREVHGSPASRCHTCFLRQPLFSFGEARIGSEDGGSSGPEWNRPQEPDADRLELQLFGCPWREVHRRLGGRPAAGELPGADRLAILRRELDAWPGRPAHGVEPQSAQCGPWQGDRPVLPPTADPLPAPSGGREDAEPPRHVARGR